MILNCHSLNKLRNRSNDTLDFTHRNWFLISRKFLLRREPTFINKILDHRSTFKNTKTFFTVYFLIVKKSSSKDMDLQIVVVVVLFLEPEFGQ